jgi:hypothetical protein
MKDLWEAILAKIPGWKNWRTDRKYEDNIKMNKKKYEMRVWTVFICLKIRAL